MPVKAGLICMKAWLRGSFVCNSISAMADSNSCALVIRIRKEKRLIVSLSRIRFVDKKNKYHSCKKFDLICCKCGSTEPDAPVNKEMNRQ